VNDIDQLNSSSPTDSTQFLTFTVFFSYTHHLHHTISISRYKQRGMRKRKKTTHEVNKNCHTLKKRPNGKEASKRPCASPCATCGVVCAGLRERCNQLRARHLPVGLFSFFIHPTGEKNFKLYLRPLQ
jgi:hypothetical protein